MGESVGIPPRYSYPATAAWFVAGAVITAVFSGSLAALTTNVELTEVFAIGMLVPSFTWAVQMTAAGIGLAAVQRRLYCGDLGRVCLLGSVALLPAAVINLSLPQAGRWLSVTNVLVSVALMGADLFRRSLRHEIAVGWPLSWCLTITVNMLLFVWSSWQWWRSA